MGAGEGEATKFRQREPLARGTAGEFRVEARELEDVEGDSIARDSVFDSAEGSEVEG